jgi:plastocyanin
MKRPIGEVDPVGIHPKPLKEINQRIMRLIIITAITVLSVSGCGDDDEGSEVTAPDQAASAPTGGATTGTVIEVDERNFTIELSTTEFAPGTYTFVATNNGQTTHALEIEGQGLEEETEDIAPGDSASLTVTLEAGEYEFYCPVGNHKEMGMELDITLE